MSFRPDRVIETRTYRADKAEHEDGVFCACRPVLHWDEGRELLTISHQDPED